MQLVKQTLILIIAILLVSGCRETRETESEEVPNGAGAGAGDGDGDGDGDPENVHTCRGEATSCEELPPSLCEEQLGCMSESECSGVASSCFTFSRSSSCISQTGCEWEEECSGIARSCFYYTYHSGCIGQEGCYWSSYSESCSGSAWSCSMMSEFSCTFQDGCILDGECSGTPWRCNSLSSYNCEQMDGCYLQPGDCSGFANSCSSLSTAESCQAQQGCSWVWSEDDLAQSGTAGAPCQTGGVCDESLECVNNICIEISGGGLDESCLPDEVCDVGLNCYEGTCLDAGGDGQFCFADDTCADGFACSGGICSPAARAKFCHCLSSAGTPAELTLRVGDVVFPSVTGLTCSECIEIPTGTVEVEVLWRGDVYMSGELDLVPPPANEVSFYATLDELIIYNEDCSEPLMCP